MVVPIGEENMTRKEMLDILHSVEFELIDPPSSWKDIGFTEREIWVNSKGYGYIMCDEPTYRGEVPGVDKEKWMIIRNKLRDKTLAFKDVEGTSLIELLEEISFGEYCEDDDLSDYLEGLLELPETQLDCIFFLQTFDGWEFFESEETWENAFERDWCDVEWEELDDEMLAEWINRLLDEKILSRIEE